MCTGSQRQNFLAGPFFPSSPKLVSGQWSCLAQEAFHCLTWLISYHLRAFLSPTRNTPAFPGSCGTTWHSWTHHNVLFSFLHFTRSDLPSLWQSSFFVMLQGLALDHSLHPQERVSLSSSSLLVVGLPWRPSVLSPRLRDGVPLLTPTCSGGLVC